MIVGKQKATTSRVGETIEFKIGDEPFRGTVTSVRARPEGLQGILIYATTAPTRYRREYTVDLTDLPLGYEGHASVTQIDGIAPFATSLTIEQESEDDDAFDDEGDGEEDED